MKYNSLIENREISKVQDRYVGDTNFKYFPNHIKVYGATEKEVSDEFSKIDVLMTENLCKYAGNTYKENTSPIHCSPTRINDILILVEDYKKYLLKCGLSENPTTK